MIAFLDEALREIAESSHEAARAGSTDPVVSSPRSQRMEDCILGPTIGYIQGSAVLMDSVNGNRR